ncbi:MAG: hypothetical protein ACKPKO_50675, partial [Candidatus Fonsibacter sp.]
MFAHGLGEVRPTPPAKTKTKSHYWEQGKPLLDPEVVVLIERYAALRSPYQPLAWRRIKWRGLAI